MTDKPPGWRLLTKAEHIELGIPPSRRVAESPSGDVVPYAQYLNAQARMSGFYSHNEYRRYAKTVAYFRSPQTNRNKIDLSLGSKGLQQLHQTIIVEKGLKKEAHGALARFLEALGVREQGADYAVGDTP